MNYLFLSIIIISLTLFIYLLNRDMKEFKNYKNKRKRLIIDPDLLYIDYLRIYKRNYRFNNLIFLFLIVLIVLSVIFLIT